MGLPPVLLTSPLGSTTNSDERPPDNHGFAVLNRELIPNCAQSEKQSKYSHKCNVADVFPIKNCELREV